MMMRHLVCFLFPLLSMATHLRDTRHLAAAPWNNWRCGARYLYTNARCEDDACAEEAMATYLACVGKNQPKIDGNILRDCALAEGPCFAACKGDVLCYGTCFANMYDCYGENAPEPEEEEVPEEEETPEEEIPEEEEAAEEETPSERRLSNEVQGWQQLNCGLQLISTASKCDDQECFDNSFHVFFACIGVDYHNIDAWKFIRCGQQEVPCAEKCPLYDMKCYATCIENAVDCYKAEDEKTPVVRRLTNEIQGWQQYGCGLQFALTASKCEDKDCFTSAWQEFNTCLEVDYPDTDVPKLIGCAQKEQTCFQVCSSDLLCYATCLGNVFDCYKTEEEKTPAERRLSNEVQGWQQYGCGLQFVVTATKCEDKDCFEHTWKEFMTCIAVDYPDTDVPKLIGCAQKEQTCFQACPSDLMCYATCISSVFDCYTAQADDEVNLLTEKINFSPFAWKHWNCGVQYMNSAINCEEKSCYDEARQVYLDCAENSSPDLDLVKMTSCAMKDVDCFQNCPQDALCYSKCVLNIFTCYQAEDVPEDPEQDEEEKDMDEELEEEPEEPGTEEPVVWKKRFPHCIEKHTQCVADCDDFLCTNACNSAAYQCRKATRAFCRGEQDVCRSKCGTWDLFCRGRCIGSYVTCKKTYHKGIADAWFQ